MNRLHKDKYISGPESDAAKEQYEAFIDFEVKQDINQFRKFDISKSRLDEFLGAFMIGVPKYKDLWKICIFIFSLSHGQAPVERGFNINEETEVENQSEESIVALRFVFDEILSRGDDIPKFQIPSELYLSCQMAHKRYTEDLEKKKNEADADKVACKRKLLVDEHMELKRRKLDEENVVLSLESSVKGYISKAANEEDHTKLKEIVTKMQSFKETIKKKKKVIIDLEGSLAKLATEIEPCKK